MNMIETTAVDLPLLPIRARCQIAISVQAEVKGETGAPVLRLAAVDGTALTFNGQPTPETRFGGPGTRGFLEVSPEPCQPPASAARPCLMVRDRHFDEQHDTRLRARGIGRQQCECVFLSNDC